MKRRDRPVARVVLLDALDRALLLDTRLAYTRVWMMPGGGVKPGEAFEEAAHRELWEEVGIRDAELSPCLWTVRFSFADRDTIVDQTERYFLARASNVEISDANREDGERDEIRACRWWSAADVEASEEEFRPRELAALLRALARGARPTEPVSALVERGARTVPAPPTAPGSISSPR